MPNRASMRRWTARWRIDVAVEHPQGTTASPSAARASSHGALRLAKSNATRDLSTRYTPCPHRCPYLVGESNTKCSLSPYPHVHVVHEVKRISQLPSAVRHTCLPRPLQTTVCPACQAPSNSLNSQEKSVPLPWKRSSRRKTHPRPSDSR